MFDASKTRANHTKSRAEEPDEPSVISNGQLRAMHAVGTLRHRKNKRKKKKLSKFERKYSALGPLLKPEQKRIDYVLVHKKKSSDKVEDEEKKKALKKKEDMRTKFEETLLAEGFSIKATEINDLVYKKLHCPFKRICKEAERVKLEMPLKGCEKYEQRTLWITEFMDKHFDTDDEVDFISAPFKMNKIDLFEGYDNPTFFFRPALRSLLTHHILINIDIRDRSAETVKVLQKRDEYLHTNMLSAPVQVVEDCMADFCPCCVMFCSDTDDSSEDLVLSKMGLPYLLMKEVYIDAYVLHEDSVLSKVNEEQAKRETREDTNMLEDAVKPDLIHDPRKDMDETWGWKAWWKFQPLWKIRNYYGEKIALYFAWAGMLVTSLWIPVLFGLACFIYGLTVSISRSEDNMKMPSNLTDLESLKWQMGELYDTLRGSFDNDVTPFFAMVICLWGTIFLEFWKRSNARLSYEWDVDQFEQNEPDRPQFFGTKVKKDPVTQEDNWFYPFKRQMLKFGLSASALIFMICIVFISLAGVVVYRVIISVDYCVDLTPVQCLLTTSVVSALLNAISILLLGRFYDWVAFRLTEWENHRTQTQYDDALIIKLFAFQFANSYASCFYIAFFRGKFDAFGVFGLGSEYNDECEGGNCMAQLSFQVLILMLAKPFPKMFKDLIIPFIKHLWRVRPNCCRNCCKNQVDDEEKNIIKSEDTRSVKKAKYFLEKERIKPELGDFTLPEYTEKIIIYGFLMLFAASFPLAPLIALIWLAIDVRIDAKRLLWLNRRPVAFIAQDIGTWYGILNLVNLIGVISNGFLIAFTSSWGSQFTTVEQLWICIGFEHIVFFVKFLLAYMIPDVPKDVRLAIRREKFQVQRKFEERVKPIDFTDLIPESTPDDRVLDDSANYGDFDSDEPTSPKHVSKELPTLTEEEEAVVVEEPSESLYSYNRVNMWYEPGGSEDPLPLSLADSQAGGMSLRKVDLQGTKLLNNKASKERLTTSDLELKSVRSFDDELPKLRGMPHHPHGDETETDYTTKLEHEAVDPYSVVSKAEIEFKRHNPDSDNDVTEC